MANFSLLPKSFQDIRTYLLSKITTQYPVLRSFLYHSFLVIFVDAVAWAIALFMDFAENLFNESKLFSATNYENVRAQAAFFKYQAKRKISAKGTIRVGMNSNYDALPLESITLRKYDAITVANKRFLIQEDTTFSSNPLDDSYIGLPSGKYYVDIPVIQGTHIVATQIGRGDQNEVLEIINSNIENSEVIFTVNGDEWTTVDTFVRSSSTDKVYTIENMENMKGITITTGDGFRGLQMPINATCTISYIETEALNAQVKSVDLEVTFLETYTYSDLTPVVFYGTNISQLVGASDVEDIEDVRYFGTISASALEDKAFNDDEIKLALQDYGGILTSKSLSEFDVNPDSPRYDYMNRVRVLVVPTTGGVLDSVTKTRIRNYLRSRMDFTDFIEFIDPTYVDIRFQTTFEVYNNTPSDFSAQVSAFLESQYTLGVLDFGESLDHSEVTYKLKNQFSSYIKRFFTTLHVVENPDTLTIPTSGIITRTLDLGGLNGVNPSIYKLVINLSFKKGTGTVYIESYEDDGSGSIIPVSGGSTNLGIDSGTIDYVSGEVNVALYPDVTELESFEFVYRPYDRNSEIENIDVAGTQIIRYLNAVNNVEFLINK